MIKIIVSLLLLVSSVFLTAPEIASAKEIAVGIDSCTTTFSSHDYSLLWPEYPVSFALPQHEEVWLTLGTMPSIGTIQEMETGDDPEYVDIIPTIIDWSGAVIERLPPGMIKGVYSVRFLDENKEQLWEEDDAIPNGGRRSFRVGADVRYIEVRSSFPSRSMKTMVKGEVYYDGVNPE